MHICIYKQTPSKRNFRPPKIYTESKGHNDSFSPFLFDMYLEEVQIEAEERDHENASIAGDDYDNDIENGDIDESYQTEIPDICRDTLIELCRTARISVENDFADDN